MNMNTDMLENILGDSKQKKNNLASHQGNYMS